MILKVLFIGGTGVISSACTQLAVDQGIDLFLLNRGQSLGNVPPAANVLTADIRDPQATAQVLAEQSFDAVVDWIAFTPEHIEADLQLFLSKTKQYIFISSASAYQTPPARLPITESTPLCNPFWEYSRQKIACEERLMQAYRQERFPMTIVRPSHTYDQTRLPFTGRYTIIDRMRQGKPIIIHGDGTSLWTLTHHRDFARGLVGLLGNPQTLGEAYHITSDEILTWNQIANIMAQAAGVEAHIVHIPSDLIARFAPEWGEGLLGDKAHSMIFDNSKIKQVVPDYTATIPFAYGAEEIMTWHDAEPSRQVVNDQHNQLIDRMIAAWENFGI